jgi:hypothetical protein
MKTFALAVLLPLLVAAPAPARANVGATRVEHSCDLHLEIIDPDPRGVNVRSGPGKPPGKVIAVLAPVGEWIDVHVVGQAGDWLLIDRAAAVDDEAPDGEREVFRGGGWLHASTLGISELWVGEGTDLRAAPADGAPLVKRYATPEEEPAKTRVLGCHAQWLEVEADGVRGFTRTFCANERTTCS